MHAMIGCEHERSCVLLKYTMLETEKQITYYPFTDIKVVCTQ